MSSGQAAQESYSTGHDGSGTYLPEMICIFYSPVDFPHMFIPKCDNTGSNRRKGRGHRSQCNMLTFAAGKLQANRNLMLRNRPQRWSIFRAMRCRLFISQQQCDTDYFWKGLTSPSLRLFSLPIGNDYFLIIAHFEDRLFCDYSRSAPHFNNSYSCYIGIISTLNSVLNST